VEEVVIEVMHVNKSTELFQTMAIVNLNMGNLNLEVNSLNNRLAIKEKEKVVLQVQLAKAKDYKHNIEIWRKSMAKNEQNIKTLFQKL